MPSTSPDLPSIDEPDAIIAHVNETLGTTLPEACKAGVVANTHLLNQHWTLLREAGDDGQ